MRMSARWMYGLLFLMVVCGHPVDATEGLPPIVIGGSISMTGRFQEPATMGMDAFRFWADEVNRAGGVLGRRVELILYDDESDVRRARMLYHRLIAEDRVDLLLSPYSTPLTVVASEVSEANGMLMMAFGAAGDKPWQGRPRYLFQLYAPASRQFIGLLDIMAKKNLRTLSVLYDETSDFNVDMARGIREWAKTFNISIVYENGYRDGIASLPGLLTQIRMHNACGLVLSAYSPDCHLLLRLLSDMAYRPAILAMPIAPVHPDFYAKAGEIGGRVFAPSQWEPDERIPFPGTRRFIDGFSAFAGHPPSFHAASAYASCQILAQAILQTQSIDNAKLRDHIAALDTVTVLGRFKVDPTGKQVGHNSFLIQWQNGKKEIVWPTKMRTATPLF